MMLAPQHKALRQAAQVVAERYSEEALRAIFPSPLVILSAPRAGSNLLFETLGESEGLWTIGGESHIVFNSFPELHPAQQQYDSGRLTEADATPEIRHLMLACFLAMAKNRAGIRWLDLPQQSRPGQIRLLEKTPRNALNLPFLGRLFPDMQVVFLHRDPRQNIASIITAWEQGLVNGKFVTFPNLPGWDRQRWCLLLPPGWRALNGKSLAEIATFQWCAANGTIQEDLELIGRDRWISVDYHDLIDDSMGTVSRIMAFAGLPLDARLQQRLAAPLPLSRTTVSAPTPDKWKRHGSEIEALSGTFMPCSEALKAADQGSIG